jgi:predicted dehydrogenase
MEPVRWGILSISGHYALRVHLPLSRLPEARIVGIASRDHEKAAAAAARLGIPKSFGSYEALLADPEIEAVYIPLPNTLHAEWSSKALEAGKHVICEKPVAMDAAQAKSMVASAKKNKRLFMEAFMYRFHPQWRRAREILDTGEIGKVRAVSCSFSYNNTDPSNIRNRMDVGGGALYDIGCYAISVSRWLVGAEPSRVISLMNRDATFGTDNLSSGLLDFGASGARASFTVATRAFPVQRVEVTGERGSMHLNLPFNAYPDMPMILEVSTGLGTRRIEAGPADQYGLMFAAFSKAIRENSTAPTAPDDAVANMAVIDALFKSEMSGGWENVKGGRGPA